MVPVPATAPVLEGVIAVDAQVFRIAVPPAVSGGMLLALAMNRRARGLRGLDVLRRSQDRAPPQRS